MKSKLKTGIKIKQSLGENLLLFINFIILLGVIAITVYPLIYIFSMSVSNKDAVLNGQVVFLPIGFSLVSYKEAFRIQGLGTAFFNTLIYVILGTLINIITTISLAYVLSRKTFFLGKALSLFCIFPMIFSGGLIPLFMVMQQFNIYNTRWAVILPLGISIYNVIIARVFISKNIPESLIESARIDGYNDVQILMKIIVPLSKSIIAIIGLYSAVLFWNQYFYSMIFAPKQKLSPLQSLLMNILVYNQQSTQNVTSRDPTVAAQQMLYMVQIKYVVIILSIIPIMMVYPFLQKYFVKGVMLGAVKE